MLTPQTLWGRKRMFEERTKMLIIAHPGLAVQDVVWVLESFIATRLYKGKADFLTRELKNNTIGPIILYVLRRQAVCDFIGQYIVKGSRRATQLSAAQR